MAPVKKVKVATKASTPARRNVVGSGPKSARSTTAGALRSFVCAIDDPFCTESYGAKIPDEYALPSESSTLRHRYTITNGSAGDYIVVTPHPALGSIAIPGTSSGAPTLSAITGVASTVAVNSVAANLLTVPVCAPVTGAGISSVYTSYRVVGWGVRIKNVTAPTSVFGDFTAGVLPVGGSIPNSLLNFMDRQGPGGVKVTNPGANWIDLARFASLPTVTFGAVNQQYGSPIVTGLDQLASFDNFTNQEVAESGGILIKPKLHSPGQAWRFRPTAPSTVGGGTSSGIGRAKLSATQGAAAATDEASLDPSAMDVSGHNVVVIQLGPSTNQTYEVEVVYHVEAIPVMASTANGGLTPVGMKTSPVVPRATLDNIITKLLQTPWVEYVKHEGSRIFGNAVQALPGLMSRTMMAALAG